MQYSKVKLPTNYKTLQLKESSLSIEPTFDIEVANDHHYLLNNGLVSHNTLSLMFRDMVMSYGMEQEFGSYYWKRTRISGKYEYYFCVPNIVRKVFADKGCPIPMNSDTVKDTWSGTIGKPIVEFIEAKAKELNIRLSRSTDISVMDKLDLMAKCMKNIDSSISITYMLPIDSDWQDIYDFILEAHRRGVKSIAAYPDKLMYGIVSFEPFEVLARRLMGQGVFIHQQNFDADELKALNMSTENINIKTGEAPKRLKTLDADIYSVNYKDNPFIIVIGKQNQMPYEIFGGHVSQAPAFAKEKSVTGQVTKNGRGNYTLTVDGHPEATIANLVEQFQPIEQDIFRLLSTMLRHGVPVQFIIEQLNKSSQSLYDIYSVTTRVLKKYIKDGQKVTGQSCPACKNQSLLYQEGCVSCGCGWSKCS